MNNRLLPTSLMARRLGVKSSWLRAEAMACRIPAIEAGGTFLFCAETVEQVLLDRARSGTATAVQTLLDAHQHGDAAAEAHAFALLREAGFPLQWASEMKGGTSRG